jgi:hypothetical protein
MKEIKMHNPPDFRLNFSLYINDDDPRTIGR